MLIFGAVFPKLEFTSPEIRDDNGIVTSQHHFLIPVCRVCALLLISLVSDELKVLVPKR